jgi:hypothetical protein
VTGRKRLGKIGHRPLADQTVRQPYRPITRKKDFAVLTRFAQLALLLIALGLAQPSFANTPCSGAKGGIARCDGPLFVCNDGSISGSKKNCSASVGGSRAPLKAVGSSNGDCPCGGGSLCVGPRGGEYCLTPSGNKSYRRK